MKKLADISVFEGLQSRANKLMGSVMAVFNEGVLGDGAYTNKIIQFVRKKCGRGLKGGYTNANLSWWIGDVLAFYIEKNEDLTSISFDDLYNKIEQEVDYAVTSLSQDSVVYGDQAMRKSGKTGFLGGKKTKTELRELDENTIQQNVLDQAVLVTIRMLKKDGYLNSKDGRYEMTAEILKPQKTITVQGNTDWWA